MANVVEITFNARDNVSSVVRGMRGAIEGFGGNVQQLGTLALGGLAAGGAAAAAGLTAIGVAGLSMNNQMEIVRAQLNAFTKDSEKTEEMLEMIRQRAAATPFAFGEMASAAASLFPVAQQSGMALEEMIAQAEILAASNPAQGMEGAAFALREAVSGDFVSLMERFNIPRNLINRLKDEGVPAAEIVGRALQEMGLDASLVSNLSQTASGRLSTFKDTLQTIASQVTQPLFDRFSAGLGGVNEKLAVLEPVIAAFAGAIADKIGAGIDAVSRFFELTSSGLPVLNSFIAAFWNILPQPVLDALINLRDNIMPGLVAFFRDNIQPLIEWSGISITFGDALTAIGIAIASVVIPALGLLLVHAAPIVLTFGALVAAVALLRTAWERDWGGIQEKTAAVVAFIQAVIGRLQAFWAEHGAAILALYTRIWTAIYNAVATYITNVYNNVMLVANALRAFWEEHGAAILAKAQEAWGLIRDFIAGIWDTITTVFAAFKLAFEGDWRGFGETLRVAWETFWQTITEFFGGVWKKLIRPVLVRLIDSFMERVTGWIDTVKRAFTDIDWGAVGAGIIDGVISGITNGIGRIAGAAREAAQAALDAAKGFLGMDSPSKAFAYVGRMSAAGFAQGLASSPAPAIGARSMAASALSAPATTTLPRAHIGAPSTVVNITAKDERALTLAMRIAMQQRRADMEAWLTR